MDLFSKLFGGTKKDDQYHLDDKKESVSTPLLKPFFSNAPVHWGLITNNFLAKNQQLVDSYAPNQSDSVIQQRKFMVNSLSLMGEINAVFERKNGSKVLNSYSDGLLDCKDRYATSCCIEKLFDKGIISLNGIAIDDNDRYGVILFDTPTPLQYFEDLRTYFISEGYKDLIYFAVDNPAEVTGEKKIKFQNFNKQCFNLNSAKQSATDRTYSQYAMWWVTETEKDFKTSSVNKNVGICLDLLEFYDSYVLGVLSFAFGLKKDNARTRLPNQDLVIIKGPEGVEILISLSQARGINFLFPMLPQYENYRNNFIKTYANFCYDIRAQIVEHDLPKDDFGQLSTLVWYNNLLVEIEKNKGNVQAVYFNSKEKWHNFNLN